MEPFQDTLGMLDLMSCPGFCVKDKKIIHINPAAQHLHLALGSPVSKWLATGIKEYQQFSGGCLYLTLDLYGQIRGASVTRVEELDIFLLEPQEQEPALQAMALAARELRNPLTSMLAIAGNLFPQSSRQQTAAREQLCRMVRSMYQLLRQVGNMSDTEHYASNAMTRMEVTDITALMGELFEKAQALVSHTGKHLTFRNLKSPAFTVADRDMLERAVWNLLANSLKFTPKGGNIHLSLTQHGKLLRLSVRDDGEGIAESLKADFFHRYRRHATIEDPRQGIGLGMALVRSVAARHGGTVLLDQPGEQGVRVTMTIAMQEAGDMVVRSPILPIDYAGELDHALIELSEVLPTELYGQLEL